MGEFGEYYGLTCINQDTLLYRSFGRKVNNDIDLSNNSIFFKLLQKIDSSFILPLSKKNISFLIKNLEIQKYDDILTSSEANLLLKNILYLQLLVNAKIPSGLSHINFPKIFSSEDYNLDFPLPQRKVLFRPDICDICKRENIPQTEINIEWTDIDNFYGWYYCCDCENKLIEYLQNTEAKKVWHLRNIETVLIERSALDSNGCRIKEYWKIKSWLPIKIKDTSSDECKYALYCSNGDFYKYILIDDLLKLNPPT
jgi:hypothetical protein